MTEFITSFRIYKKQEPPSINGGSRRARLLWALQGSNLWPLPCENSHRLSWRNKSVPQTVLFIELLRFYNYCYTSCNCHRL